MKKLLSLFLLPLISAGHTGSAPLVDTVQSTGPNWTLIIGIFVVIALVYYLMKGGSRK